MNDFEQIETFEIFSYILLSFRLAFPNPDLRVYILPPLSRCESWPVNRDCLS